MLRQNLMTPGVEAYPKEQRQFQAQQSPLTHSRPAQVWGQISETEVTERCKAETGVLETCTVVFLKTNQLLLSSDTQKRDNRISLQMFVSLHVAGNWTQTFWKSSQCSSLQLLHSIL